MHTLFGAAYDGAIVPLALLASSFRCSSSPVLQGTVLAAGSDERGLVWVSAIVGVATVALDLALVPVFEANGAAAVMVAIRVLAFVAFAVRTRRTTQIHAPGPAVGASSLRCWPPGLVSSAAILGSWCPWVVPF